jgi:hypothetical protein
MDRTWVAGVPIRTYPVVTTKLGLNFPNPLPLYDYSRSDCYSWQCRNVTGQYRKCLKVQLQSLKNLSLRAQPALFKCDSSMIHICVQLKLRTQYSYNTVLSYDRRRASVLIFFFANNSSDPRSASRSNIILNVQLTVSGDCL